MRLVQGLNVKKLTLSGPVIVDKAHAADFMLLARDLVLHFLTPVPVVIICNGRFWHLVLVLTSVIVHSLAMLFAARIEPEIGCPRREIASLGKLLLLNLNVSIAGRHIYVEGRYIFRKGNLNASSAPRRNFTLPVRRLRVSHNRLFIRL